MKKDRNIKSRFHCVLHGSFLKHIDEIRRIHCLFTKAGIEVLAPANSEITAVEDGFVFFEDDKSDDPRMVELVYLHNLKKLGENDFSYFVNPEGYIGRSTSYELGIAQVSNINHYFLEKPADHPVYFHKNAVWEPEHLVEYIKEHGRLPEPRSKRNEAAIHKLWQDLIVPGSVVAVGGIIEYQLPRRRGKEVLLVKTHKWGGRYSMVGGKVRRNERLADSLKREIREETCLRARIGRHICTFDQIKNSGYYQTGTNHIFVDNVVQVDSKKVRLNEEAEDYIWIPASAALRDLPVEPNTRHTLELYIKLQSNYAV